MLTGHTAGSIIRVMVPDRPGATEEGAAFALSRKSVAVLQQ
jgi:hypothetical protein